MRNNPRMPNATPESLIEALTWRYATKKFDPSKTIPAETWSALEQSMVLTPSSFGLQPWKFLIVENPDVRRELFTASWSQTQVTDASHFVVLLARTDMEAADVDSWMERMVEVQGSSLEALEPLKNMITGFSGSMPVEARFAWNSRQIYIALGQLMAAAAMLGVDSCPMEGLDAKAYDAILKLEGTGYKTVVACALGYRAEDDRYAGIPKARFDSSRVIARI